MPSESGTSTRVSLATPRNGGIGEAPHRVTSELIHSSLAPEARCMDGECTCLTAVCRWEMSGFSFALCCV